MRRRTRALTEIIAAVLGLLLQVSVLKWARNNEEAPNEPAGVSVFGLAAGALYRGVYLRIRDRDLGGVETSPYRRFLFGVCSYRLKKRALLWTMAFRSSFSVSETIRAIGYRCWYDLLRPLPGADS